MDSLSLLATIENMDRVLRFVQERIEKCPPKVQNQISIAVDEIFSNIARYAYHPDTGSASVRIAVGEDITLEFEDKGVAFNPLEQDEPDVSLPMEERETGGLGLFMVKNIMDSVEYRRDGDRNILTIHKKI